jgi:pullulanase/glycogen debranching enzyme
MPDSERQEGQRVAYDLKHRTTKTVAKGMHFPLDATLAPDGVNFAVYSKNATEVFLLLFDKPDGEPTDIIQFTAINSSGTPWSTG